MARKPCACGICENINSPSVCVVCVNRRINDRYKGIILLQHERDSLHRRLDEKLKAKDKAGEQRRWMYIHAEKIAQLKEQLHLKESQLLQEKYELEKKTNELHSREAFLADAFKALEMNVAEKQKKYTDAICVESSGQTAIRLELLQKQSIAIRQICRVFPLCKVHDVGEKKDGSSSDNYHQICNVHLPKGTKPQSVSMEELGASLGYMLQLLNLVVRYLYAPLLLNSGFAGSCSRVWQRASYWDSRPASRSKELPLFIPHQNVTTANLENSWPERSSNNYGVASMESESSGRHHLDGMVGNFGNSSLHSIEMHKDLSEGIFLLKKSVACVTTYFYNSFSLPPPPRVSTFEAFEKLLVFVSSKDARAFLSSKEAKSRRQMQQPNKLGVDQSVADSRISSSSLEESKHAKVGMKFGIGNGSSRIISFVPANLVADMRKTESVIDGWDIVEHPTLPPPPSDSENIEHWTRAMIIDVKKQ